MPSSIPFTHPPTYPRQVEEPPGGDHDRVLVVLVRDINDVLDPALDDELGAFVAREQGHVHPAACECMRVKGEEGEDRQVGGWDGLRGGKNEDVVPCKGAMFRFKIAFISAWQT